MVSFCRCAHYRRRCRIRAPCCNEIFDCRHCHNDIKARNFILNCWHSKPLITFTYSLLQNSIYLDQKERHEIPRHEVDQVNRRTQLSTMVWYCPLINPWSFPKLVNVGLTPNNPQQSSPRTKYTIYKPPLNRGSTPFSGALEQSTL